jgi:hypothetical protein
MSSTAQTKDWYLLDQCNLLSLGKVGKMPLNKRRKYSNIKWVKGGVIGQAAQVAVDRYVESLGATIRTGGSQDFVVANPQTNTAKKNRNILRKVTRSKAKPSERPTGINGDG